MEFTIVLVPGTSLVPMAPYQMFVTELSELKKKLYAKLSKCVFWSEK